MVTGYGAAEWDISIFSPVPFYENENDNGVIGFTAFRTRSQRFLLKFVSAVQNEQKTLHAFAGAEYAEAEGNRGSSEKKSSELQSRRAFKLNDFVTLKTELSRLEYAIPIQLGGSAQNLSIDRNGIALNLVVTY